MASYRELRVWQKSMDLVVEIYHLCKELPKEELYSLFDQMRRAAISIASNIAEGQGRGSDKEFVRFLAIAQGSRAELETQLEICVRLNYLSDDRISLAKKLTEETGKMIRTLTRTINHRITSSPTDHQLPTTDKK